MFKQLSISFHLPWRQRQQIFSEILENLYQTKQHQTLKESSFRVHFYVQTVYVANLSFMLKNKLEAWDGSTGDLNAMKLWERREFCLSLWEWEGYSVQNDEFI